MIQVCPQCGSNVESWIDYLGDRRITCSDSECDYSSTNPHTSSPMVLIRRIIHRYKHLTGCVDCGRTDRILDYDHDGTEDEKLFEMANPWGWTPEEIWVEFMKCKVRCKRCHGKRHATANWSKSRNSTR